MSDSGVRFIKKNGKTIPIAGAAITGVRAASAVRHAIKRRQSAPKAPAQMKVNRSLDLTGLGLSVASGAIAAATFSTPKGLVTGHAAAKALDVAGVAANVASVAGRGHGKERLKQGARQEARNFVVGNAVFAAGVIGIKKNRKALAGYAQKIISLGRKALRVG